LKNQQLGKRAGHILLWLRWADTDYRAARVLIRAGALVQGAAVSDTAIEKYLKALYVEQGLAIPQNHEVAKLYAYIKWKTASDLDVNQSYLRLLEKAYKLRYPDDVGEGFNIALNQARLLAELDRTVRKMTERIRATEYATGKSIPMVLERAAQDNDQGIILDNVAMDSGIVDGLFSNASPSYDLRKFKGDVFETDYVTKSVKDDANHEREGFVIKADFQFEAAYLPMLDSPNTATRNGVPLKRVPQD